MPAVMMLDVQDSYELQNSENRYRVEENRRSTNVPFVYLFALISILWFGIFCFAVANYDAKLMTRATNETNNETPADLIESIRQDFTSGVITASLCTIFTLISIALIRTIFAKFTVYLGLYFTGAITCMFVALLVLSIYGSLKTHDRLLVFMLITLVVSVVGLSYVTATFHSYEGAGIQLMTEMTREPCRNMLHHPATLLFTFCMFLLQILVAKVGITALYCSVPYNDYFVFYGALVFLFVVLYMMNFVYCLNVTVIATSYATCVWSKDLVEPSNYQLVKNVGRVFKYHLGTVAYAATFFLPFFHGLYLLLATRKMKTERSGGLLVRTWAKVLLAFDAPWFMLVDTAATGNCGRASTIKIYQLITRNSSLYFAMSNMRLLNLKIIVGLIGYILYVFTRVSYLGEISEMLALVAGICGIAAFLAHVFSPLDAATYTAAKTIKYCTMLNIEKDDLL